MGPVRAQRRRVLELDLRLNLPNGVTITGTPTFTARPPGLVLENAAVEGTVVRVWLTPALSPRAAQSLGMEGAMTRLPMTRSPLRDGWCGP
jgi:hypothetical protein